MKKINIHRVFEKGKIFQPMSTINPFRIGVPCIESTRINSTSLLPLIKNYLNEWISHLNMLIVDLLKV